MGILNEYNFKGIVASYWKILQTFSDTIANKTIVTLGLYATAEARKKDINNYLTTINVEVSGVDYSREELYLEIKKLDGWINTTNA